MFSHCLFNLYAEYIMQNAGLDESQAGIKIARRNNNNLIYVDTTLMAEQRRTKEPFDEGESEKDGLKVNIQKLRSWHPVPPLHGKQGKSRSSDKFYFLGLQNHCRW